MCKNSGAPADFVYVTRQQSDACTSTRMTNGRPATQAEHLCGSDMQTAAGHGNRDQRQVRMAD
jgi:hypothetical protein